MLRLIFCLFCLAIFSCAPKGDTQPQQKKITPQEIRLQQQERTSLLRKVVGRGVIEFHWRDEDGKHRVQGDFDFWRLDNAISLRISKSGEVLMWMGGDEQNHWMFELLGDETTLSINQEDVFFSDILDTLVLLGLDPLPKGETTVENGVITVKANPRTWVATFDPLTHRILEIEVEDAHHQISALHHEGIKVELLQKNRLVWPVTGKLIDIESSTNDATTKIDFAWISTDTSEERMDRVFDLSFLQRALKPTVIEEPPQ
ncbi:MAG: hypothetical protein HOC93_08855 [Phycisphaerae bacterium]|jgi:hypothetical protein|nr:hypothetical protein [Phycisphaerae bacterium]HJN71883.1 hypothetical protein [Phycisphaerales bacterium]|tara:strand:- start:6530 stop:7306 length:777 start_codon:yes stop_codon:yes gene_type:complete